MIHELDDEAPAPSTVRGHTPATLRAVVFDLDGVLVDSEPISCAATADLLAAHGHPIGADEVRRLFLGRSMASIYAHFRALGVELPTTFAQEKERLYIERARGRLRAFDGAHDVVARIAARRPVAIASSGSPAKIAFSLAETGLSSLFRVVCSAAEVAHGKPAPDLFRLAASRLGVAATECAVVEDALPGLAAARAAGAFAIGIATSHPRAELAAESPAVILDTLMDLPAVVLA